MNLNLFEMMALSDEEAISAGELARRSGADEQLIGVIEFAGHESYSSR